MNQALNDEKETSGSRLVVCDRLKEELKLLEEKWQASNDENKKLSHRVNELLNEQKNDSEKMPETVQHSSIMSNEELTKIEEELVLFKEKYAQSCEDKLKLQRELLKLRVQYNMMCDSVYNKYFWYFGPLVIVVIFLLIREWIS